MPRSGASPDVATVKVVIPIAVFTLIDGGTAWSSPFQRTPKIVHDHAGIVFTFRWNLRSLCAGNRDHDRPEYAAGEGEESFDIVVCTSRWLGRQVEIKRIVEGRHHLFVRKFDLVQLHAFLHGYGVRCVGTTWSEVAERLARLGRWEFEDYVA
jgi:hypothetical protein